MSYKLTNLSILAYTNEFTWWHYVTDDTMLEVASKGYFDQDYDLLRTGDIFFINIGSETTIVTVKSINNGRVTIKNLTSFNSKE